MKNSILFGSFFGLLICFASNIAFAKTLNLYDAPKTDAKQIGTIETDKGIVPIYSPKGNEWIKVGDPANGNVGWIKQADLNSVQGVTIMQRFITTGKGPHAYQFIQYGSPQALSPAETQATIKRIEQNQQQVQKAMNEMMQTMFKNIEQPMPVILPVLYVAPPKTQAAPATKKS